MQDIDFELIDKVEYDLDYALGYLPDNDFLISINKYYAEYDELTPRQTEVLNQIVDALRDCFPYYGVHHDHQ